MVWSIQVCSGVFVESHLAGKNVILFKRGEEFEFERLVSRPGPVRVFRIQSVTEIDHLGLTCSDALDEAACLRLRRRLRLRVLSLTRGEKKPAKQNGRPFH